MTETLFDNFGRPYVLPGVYSDYRHGFELIHIAPDGSRTPYPLQDEPVGWSALKWTLKRGELHGVNSEFTASDTALEFDTVSGRDFIQAIFLSEGEDATILLHYLLIVDAQTQIIEYEGRLNLSTRKTAQRRISCSLERNTLQSRITASQSTNLNLSTSRALTPGNDPITPPTFSTIPLTPQTLTASLVCNNPSSPMTQQTFMGDTNGHIWLQYDTSNPQLSEIQGFVSGKPLGISEDDGPIADDNYLFKFTDTGVRQFKLEVAFQLWVSIKKRTISIGPAYIKGYSLVTRFMLKRVDGSIEEIGIPEDQIVGSYRNPGVDYSQNDLFITFTGSLSFERETKPGDKLFLYSKFSFGHNKNELQQTQVSFKPTTFRFSVTSTAHNTATSVRCLPIGKALETCITVMTGLSDRFRSDYYSLKSDRYAVDGCGARRVVFNGFAARNFKPLERPLSVSFEDLVNSGVAIDAIGLEYGFDVSDPAHPLEIVRLEPASHFYRPNELMRFDEVGEYSEESVAAEIYSTVNVGYEEFVTEGAGSLEEVFTTHQVRTPIVHESTPKTITSKLIASSLAIEQTRREQFADTPKDGTSYDEKAFIVQCKPIPSFSGTATLSPGSLAPGIVQLTKPVGWLSPGLKIALGGTAKNNGVFTVSYVSDLSKRPWSFYVKEGLFDEVAFALTIQSADNTLALQPETGSDFDQVSGLASPDDTLNLRLTPGRMLLTTAPLWAGCLINKDAYNLINKKPVTETGLITVNFSQIAIFSVITTDIYYDWIAPGMSVTIAGSAHNNGTFTVLAVSAPDYTPWGFGVKEVLTPETANGVNISFESISNADLQAAVNKTKIPNNKSVSTVLPASQTCAKAGTVTEAAPVPVDELIDSLLYLPRLLKFKRRLSHAEIQRMRLGHAGLLPTELDANGKPVDPNYGYISCLNEAGIRVAGYLNSVEYSRDDESAVFELKQCALDLNDTFSGSCAEFAGMTLAQASALSDAKRRRLELCRLIDVDPL